MPLSAAVQIFMDDPLKSHSDLVFFSRSLRFKKKKYFKNKDFYAKNLS
jgi:hypothetical protein